MTFAALAAVAGLMLIAAVTLPTMAYAVKGENPKTETDRGPRTNPNNKELPEGAGSETTETEEACAVSSGNTPPGHAPEDGECKGGADYECIQTSQEFLPNGKPKAEPTTTAC